MTRDVEPDLGTSVFGEPLPEGERLLWTGRPKAAALAREAYHVRGVMAWFGLIAAWRIGATLFSPEGNGSIPLMADLAWLAVVSGVAVAMIGLLAWLTARTTRYALTNRRALLRIGIALPTTVNVPLDRVTSADWRGTGGGTGDVSLRTDGSVRLGYALLWPHARPWKLRNPEPTFRCVTEVEPLLAMLSAALRSACEGGVEVPSRVRAAGASRSPVRARRPALAAGSALDRIQAQEAR